MCGSRGAIRRIPVREHEPLGNARLRFAEIRQPWLREAIKWFFAAALEHGVLAWTSLPGYRTYLGQLLLGVPARAGIDHPRLVEDESELRGVALRSSRICVGVGVDGAAGRCRL